MLTNLVMISTLGGNLGAGTMASRLGTSTAASQSYTSMGFAANTAVFLPIKIPVAGTILKLWVTNGATATGNIDVGLYDSALGRAVNRLLSAGSTAQAGTNAKQSFDVTDTLVMPGLYFMAVAADSTSATFATVSMQSNAQARLHGASQQTSALPLPSTHTFANMAAASIIDCGIAFRPLV